MVKKKEEPVYVFHAWKIKLTFRALAFIISSMILGTILIVNIGYNKKSGCYWKPADVKIDIKKNTARP